jgi:hypothetical protein
MPYKTATIAYLVCSRMTFLESKIVDAASMVRRQHSRVPVPIQRKMLLEVFWALNI